MVPYLTIIKTNNIKSKSPWVKVNNPIGLARFAAPPSVAWSNLAGRVDYIPIIIRGLITKKSIREIINEVESWEIDPKDIINIDRFNPITLEVIIK